MDYSALLRRSWLITWHHRYLWLLAFFAGEGAGGSINVGRGIPTPSGRGGASSAAPPPGLRPVLDWVFQHAALLALLGLLLVVVFAVFFVISCVAAGAVVRAADLIQAGENPGLGGAWSAGVRSFGRVLRLRLLLLLAYLALALAYAALAGLGVLFVLARQWGGLAVVVIWGLGLTGLVFGAAVAVPTWLRLALRQLVLDGSGAIEALRGGARLIFRRIGQVVLLWLIELGFSIGFGIALLLAAVALVLPGVALFGIGFGAGGVGVGIALSAIYALVAIVLMAVVSAGFAAYFSVFWTLGYRRLRALPA
jgi:hypothetical protein